MRNEHKIITYVYGAVSIFMWFVAFLFVMALTSCKSIEYVPVETVRTDTVYQNKVMRDSVYCHDSTLIYTKGDTVFRDRWNMKHVYHLDTNTVYQAKIVKEPQPYPVVKEVNVLHWWQKVLMYVGAIFILLLINWILHKLHK